MSTYRDIALQDKLQDLFRIQANTLKQELLYAHFCAGTLPFDSLNDIQLHGNELVTSTTFNIAFQHLLDNDLYLENILLEKSTYGFDSPYFAIQEVSDVRDWSLADKALMMRRRVDFLLALSDNDAAFVSWSPKNEVMWLPEPESSVDYGNTLDNRVTYINNFIQYYKHRRMLRLSEGTVFLQIPQTVEPTAVKFQQLEELYKLTGLTVLDTLPSELEEAVPNDFAANQFKGKIVVPDPNVKTPWGKLARCSYFVATNEGLKCIMVNERGQVTGVEDLRDLGFTNVGGIDRWLICDFVNVNEEPTLVLVGIDKDTQDGSDEGFVRLFYASLTEYVPLFDETTLYEMRGVYLDGVNGLPLDKIWDIHNFSDDCSLALMEHGGFLMFGDFPYGFPTNERVFRQAAQGTVDDYLSLHTIDAMHEHSGSDWYRLNIRNMEAKAVIGQENQSNQGIYWSQSTDSTSPAITPTTVTWTGTVVNNTAMSVDPWAISLAETGLEATDCTWDKIVAIASHAHDADHGAENLRDVLLLKKSLDSESKHNYLYGFIHGVEQWVKVHDWGIITDADTGHSRNWWGMIKCGNNGTPTALGVVFTRMRCKLSDQYDGWMQSWFGVNSANVADTLKGTAAFRRDSDESGVWYDLNNLSTALTATLIYQRTGSSFLSFRDFLSSSVNTDSLYDLRKLFPKTDDSTACYADSAKASSYDASRDSVERAVLSAMNQKITSVVEQSPLKPVLTYQALTKDKIDYEVTNVLDDGDVKTACEEVAKQYIEAGKWTDAAYKRRTKPIDWAKVALAAYGSQYYATARQIAIWHNENKAYTNRQQPFSEHKTYHTNDACLYRTSTSNPYQLYRCTVDRHKGTWDDDDFDTFVPHELGSSIPSEAGVMNGVLDTWYGAPKAFNSYATAFAKYSFESRAVLGWYDGKPLDEIEEYQSEGVYSPGMLVRKQVSDKPVCYKCTTPYNLDAETKFDLCFEACNEASFDATRYYKAGDCVYQEAAGGTRTYYKCVDDWGPNNLPSNPPKVIETFTAIPNISEFYKLFADDGVEPPEQGVMWELSRTATAVTVLICKGWLDATGDDEAEAITDYFEPVVASEIPSDAVKFETPINTSPELIDEDQFIRLNGQWYRCLQPFEWAAYLGVPQSITSPNYNNTTSYKAAAFDDNGMLVDGEHSITQKDGVFYLCQYNTSSAANALTSSGSFSVLPQSQPGPTEPQVWIKIFEITDTYSVGDIIRRDDQLYSCTAPYRGNAFETCFTLATATPPQGSVQGLAVQITVKDGDTVKSTITLACPFENVYRSYTTSADVSTLATTLQVDNTIGWVSDACPDVTVTLSTEGGGIGLTTVRHTYTENITTDGVTTAYPFELVSEVRLSSLAKTGSSYTLDASFVSCTVNGYRAEYSTNPKIGQYVTLEFPSRQFEFKLVNLSGAAIYSATVSTDGTVPTNSSACAPIVRDGIFMLGDIANAYDQLSVPIKFINDTVSWYIERNLFVYSVGDFSASVAYHRGDLCKRSGVLYRCSVETHEGSWVAAHFQYFGGFTTPSLGRTSDDMNPTTDPLGYYTWCCLPLKYEGVGHPFLASADKNGQTQTNTLVSWLMANRSSPVGSLYRTNVEITQNPQFVTLDEATPANPNLDQYQCQFKVDCELTITQKEGPFATTRWQKTATAYYSCVVTMTTKTKVDTTGHVVKDPATSTVTVADGHWTAGVARHSGSATSDISINLSRTTVNWGTYWTDAMAAGTLRINDVTKYVNAVYSGTETPNTTTVGEVKETFQIISLLGVVSTDEMPEEEQVFYTTLTGFCREYACINPYIQDQSNEIADIAADIDGRISSTDIWFQSAKDYLAMNVLPESINKPIDVAARAVADPETDERFWTVGINLNITPDAYDILKTRLGRVVRDLIAAKERKDDNQVFVGDSLLSTLSVGSSSDVHETVMDAGLDCINHVWGKPFVVYDYVKLGLPEKLYHIQDSGQLKDVLIGIADVEVSDYINTPPGKGKKVLTYSVASIRAAINADRLGDDVKPMPIVPSSVQVVPFEVKQGDPPFTMSSSSCLVPIFWVRPPRTNEFTKHLPNGTATTSYEVTSDWYYPYMEYGQIRGLFKFLDCDGVERRIKHLVYSPFLGRLILAIDETGMPYARRNNLYAFEGSNLKSMQDLIYILDERVNCTVYKTKYSGYEGPTSDNVTIQSLWLSDRREADHTTEDFETANDTRGEFVLLVEFSDKQIQRFTFTTRMESDPYGRMALSNIFPDPNLTAAYRQFFDEVIYSIVKTDSGLTLATSHGFTDFASDGGQGYACQTGRVPFATIPRIFPTADLVYTSYYLDKDLKLRSVNIQDNLVDVFPYSTIDLCQLYPPFKEMLNDKPNQKNLIVYDVDMSMWSAKSSMSYFIVYTNKGVLLLDAGLGPSPLQYENKSAIEDYFYGKVEASFDAHIKSKHGEKTLLSRFLDYRRKISDFTVYDFATLTTDVKYTSPTERYGGMTTEATKSVIADKQVFIGGSVVCRAEDNPGVVFAAVNSPISRYDSRWRKVQVASPLIDTEFYDYFYQIEEAPNGSQLLTHILNLNHIPFIYRHNTDHTWDMWINIPSTMTPYMNRIVGSTLNAHSGRMRVESNYARTRANLNNVTLIADPVEEATKVRLYINLAYFHAASIQNAVIANGSLPMHVYRDTTANDGLFDGVALQSVWNKSVETVTDAHGVAYAMIEFSVWGSDEQSIHLSGETSQESSN